ncbi:MAG: hypothetical protein H6585_09530 [Flavobacteriales bacterium]|nr:hypothetical protein [Flavobacteriales bacterium]MCB9448570.1 hypothetical protein [Flavobacteriales bacterium]
METIKDTSDKTKRPSPYGIGGIVFVGCMFLGMGIGIALGSKQIGMYIGMGAGFVAMALVTQLRRP